MLHSLLLNIFLFRNIYIQPVAMFLSKETCNYSMNNGTQNWKTYYENNLKLSFKYPLENLPYVYQDFGTTFYSEHKVGNAGIEDISISFISIPKDMRKGVEISIDGLYNLAKDRDRTDEVIDLNTTMICGKKGVESFSNWKLAGNLLEKYHEFYFIKGNDVILAQLVIGSKYLNTATEVKYADIFEKMLYFVLVNN